MKFKPLSKYISKNKIIDYFIKHKIFSNKDYIKKIEKNNNPFSNEHVSKNNIKQFGPELFDLYRLHQLVIRYRRVTILEFGVGWSTKIFSNALLINKKKYFSRVKNLRFNNPFEIHAIDNFKMYINETKKKLSKSEKKNTNIHFSEVNMTQFNGRICTEYKSLPQINPDLIYLDGPSQFKTKGKVNNISTAHKDFMPMSCDILKIEFFLKPGTIIVVDGRTSNLRFLLSHFKRKWKLIEDFANDQYILLLDEKPLGNLNKKQIEFFFK